MAKSFRFKNDIYLDSSAIMHEKFPLKDKFYHNNTWQTTYVIQYYSNRPRIIFVIWETTAFAVYSIYNGRVIELGKIGTGTITYTVDTTNKTITFKLSNTGLITALDI